MKEHNWFICSWNPREREARALATPAQTFSLVFAYCVILKRSDRDAMPLRAITSPCGRVENLTDFDLGSLLLGFGFWVVK